MYAFLVSNNVPVDLDWCQWCLVSIAECQRQCAALVPAVTESHKTAAEY